MSKNGLLIYNKYSSYYEPVEYLIKIIDFGGAVFNDERHTGIINTRQYRPPEVQLQCCKWGPASDIWGIGCILAELYTGKEITIVYF